MLISEYPGLAVALVDDRLLASVHPLPERPLLDLDQLHGLLDRAGYGTSVLSDEALLTLVEHYNTAGKEFELAIGECCAASFALELAPDAMHAWLNIVPARGGRTLDRDEIVMALGAAGVTFGIDEAALAAAIAASAAKTNEHCLVASGIAAENGADTRFELLVADARDRTPQPDEHGVIDFRELGAIPLVEAEQGLMRRIPPTTGTAGRNVRGEVLEPLPGRPEAFSQNLLGAYVANDDSNLLRAVFSGQPVRCGNGVTVEHVLHLRNVNMASGNISFDGTVDIAGEVLPGMKVHATGDIIVGDIVDGAELGAGGDIRVAGGIIAKARVHAGGSVTARFVENAQVTAGTTIAIDDTALQSDLQANNQIIVGVKAPQRGRLAGGSARATMLIRVPILGSPTGGLTHLLLGVNPVLEARYQALLAEIQKRREEEDKLEKLVKHLAAQGNKADLLERARASWQLAIQGWAHLLPERAVLESQLALIAEARVDIGVGVAGAVDMTFGKKLVHLRRNYETGGFSLDGERIVFADHLGVSAAG